MAIDRDRLLQLAADANKSTADISEALGLGAAHNFYYELNKDPELKEAFRAARMEANNGKPSRASARAPKTRLKKTRASKSALPALPPPTGYKRCDSYSGRD